MSKGKLGVIGGMGPQAMLLFCQKIVDLTDARSDQAHLPMLILNDTQMPDRTAALLSGETQPVHDRLLADGRTLEAWGATAVAVTCNTAHAFLPQVQKGLGVPIVNMIEETAGALQALGAKKVGILGTDGTLKTRLYHQALEARGITPVVPPREEQALVMSIIYDEIKQGHRGSPDKFAAADRALHAAGCDRIVLACTEMSTYKDWHGLDDFYVDAMDILARRCIQICGYPTKG